MKNENKQKYLQNLRDIKHTLEINLTNINQRIFNCELNIENTSDGQKDDLFEVFANVSKPKKRGVLMINFICMVIFCLLLVVGVMTNTYVYIFAIGTLILIEIMAINLKEIFREINIDNRNY